MKTTHINERQALVDLFLMGCRETDACPPCAMSAALYAAALGALKGLHLTEESFLDAAKEIYKDVREQLTPGKLVT
jgi:hypothetical protein